VTNHELSCQTKKNIEAPQENFFDKIEEKEGVVYEAGSF
jgi:hypothetical protein